MSLRLAWATEQESAEGKQKGSKKAKRGRKERRKERGGGREDGRKGRGKESNSKRRLSIFWSFLTFSHSNNIMP